MAQVYHEKYGNARLEFRRIWVTEPRHSENVLAKKCYLYRSTPHKLLTPHGCIASHSPTQRGRIRQCVRSMNVSDRRITVGLAASLGRRRYRAATRIIPGVTRIFVSGNTRLPSGFWLGFHVGCPSYSICSIYQRLTSALFSKSVLEIEIEIESRFCHFSPRSRKTSRCYFDITEFF